MENRYKMFAARGVRNIDGYNKVVAELIDEPEVKKMPRIVIIIDELADLMMTAPKEVEDSINRIAAWVIGMRNAQKALLYALLSPNAALAKMQDEGDYTSLMAVQEQVKTYPLGDVWDEFCKQMGVPSDAEWLSIVREYEKDVLLKR